MELEEGVARIVVVVNHGNSVSLPLAVAGDNRVVHDLSVAPLVELLHSLVIHLTLILVFDFIVSSIDEVKNRGG